MPIFAKQHIMSLLSEIILLPKTKISMKILGVSKISFFALKLAT
jgi:hypothetical protein